MFRAGYDLSARLAGHFVQEKAPHVQEKFTPHLVYLHGTRKSFPYRKRFPTYGKSSFRTCILRGTVKSFPCRKRLTRAGKMLVTRRGRPADPASPSRVGDIPRRVRPDPPCRKRVRAGQVPRAPESTLHAERDPPRSKSRNPGKVIFPMDEAFLVPEKALRTGSSGLSDFSALSVPAPSPTLASRICHRWRGSCRSASGYRIDEASHHATHPPSRPAQGDYAWYSIDEASQSLRTYRHSLRGSLRGIIASMKLLPHLTLAVATRAGLRVVSY